MHAYEGGRLGLTPPPQVGLVRGQKTRIGRGFRGKKWKTIVHGEDLLVFLAVFCE